MTLKSKQLGNQAESLAATWLQRSKNYHIIAQNLRTNRGEIDILAQDGQTLVIVEVKAKTSAKYGYALEMITPAKRRQLILLTFELQQQYKTEKVRIDIVTVDSAASRPDIKLYKGLVELNQ